MGSQVGRCTLRRWRGIGLATCLAASPLPARAADSIDSIEQLVITATRTPERVDQVPADIVVISGEELRARGAEDLRTSLSLVSGVEAPPGGDSGPSSAVPSFWGLHEFDAFLLVADGVPWGGAFNPSISTLDLNDVQRIEVLKGAAPVMYGATSFVGVIHVIHYPAGQAANRVDASAGSYGSSRGSASFVLPSIGAYQQSIAVGAEDLGFADKRESVKDVRMLYRGSAPWDGGTFQFDANLTLGHNTPPSPIVRDGAHLTSRTPINANYNPADGRIEEHRYQIRLGYSRPTPLGLWESTASFAHSDIRDVRGFLRPDLEDDGSENADSQNQHRLINDGYFDTHLISKFGDRVNLVWGADLLYGLGRQRSINGAYYVPISGLILPPSTESLHVDEVNTIADRRIFIGEYAQVDWKPTARWDFVAGLRLNETDEQKASAHMDGFDPAADESDRQTHHKVGVTGTIGASYRAWMDGADEAVVYADYRNTFKPAAIDFGPDNRPDILNPETARSYEAGIKGALAAGHIGYNAELYLLDFTNLVVATTDSLGNPALRNAGGERLKGVEIDTRYFLTPDLSLAANISYHDARFTHFVIDQDGTQTDVSGKQLTLSPRVLASGGVIYSPPDGLRSSVVVSYVSRRFLDEANTASAPSYITVDAMLGYRWGRYEIGLHGYNLANTRPPVTQSEFGSSSYYLLPARAWFVKLSASL